MWLSDSHKTISPLLKFEQSTFLDVSVMRSAESDEKRGSKKNKTKSVRLLLSSIYLFHFHGAGEQNLMSLQFDIHDTLSGSSTSEEAAASTTLHAQNDGNGPTTEKKAEAHVANVPYASVLSEECKKYEYQLFDQQLRQACYSLIRSLKMNRCACALNLTKKVASATSAEFKGRQYSCIVQQIPGSTEYAIVVGFTPDDVIAWIVKHVSWSAVSPAN